MKQEKKTITSGPHILRFDITDVHRIFFTSDLHINHTNIINYCNRPFSNIEEMNNTLINNLNNELSKVDNPILINCGDFIFSNVSIYEDIIQSINAYKIYNIIGNHDLKNIIQRRELVPYNESDKSFWSTEIVIQIYDSKKDKILVNFTVSHCPHCDGQFLGTFNIHGHLHTPKNLDEYNGSDINTARKLKEKAMCYDVGVDGNNYKPVPLSDILTGNLNMYQLKNINFDKWRLLLAQKNTKE